MLMGSGKFGRVGVLICAQLALFVSAKDCLLGAGGKQIPFRLDNRYPHLPSGTQAIITSYKFRCCGNITAWQTYVQPGSRRHRGVHDITFQVWRPSPTVQESGCYSMVGENRYTSISLQRGGKVSETPEPSNILSVQSGDVVGYFIISRRGKDGIQLDNNNDDEDDSVWYDTISPSKLLNAGVTNCPLAVGTETGRILRSSTNAAPVLSVRVFSFVCPPTPTRSPSSSSRPPSMTATTNSLLTLLSSTISLPPLTSTHHPSSSSEPTVASSLSTKQLPTSTISPSSSSIPPSSSSSRLPSMAATTNSLLTQLSSTISLPPLASNHHSSSLSEPTVASSLSTEQLASPTFFVSPVVNSNGLHGKVAAGLVVVVVILMISVMVVLLLLWRRKRLQKNIKLDVSGNHLDLSNPNNLGLSNPNNLGLSNPDYRSSSLSSVLQQQRSKKQQSQPTPTPYELPSIPAGGLDRVTNVYESPSEEPVDYSYSTSSHTILADSSNTYTFIPDPCSNGDAGRSPEITCSSDDVALYHAVGPNIKDCVTDSASNGRTIPPLLPPPVPMRNGKEHVGFWHMLEGAPEDSSVLYEDPTLPKFRESNSIKQNGAFESTGYYVPTEEQRKGFAPNVEQRYESTSAAYNQLNFFEEDQIYWAPATTASGLYSQLSSKRYREIQRDQIRIVKQLGSGQFGDVCSALWTVGGHTQELAVKTLKPGASDEDKVKFLQEAAINGQFSHSNVIKMHGIVTLGEPVLICLEILANGDLRSYLQGLNLSGSKHGDFMEAQIMFLKFAKNIAAGMEYLSKKNFVHRDLATRNILLNKSLTCKVADFGMARDLMDDTYYTSSGGKIPLKWTAPEALLYKKYSADSDVWSYGMVLFEIWSVAKKPFSTVSNSQLLRLIQIGFCQAPPPGCPRAVYELMVDCWNPDHLARPCFGKICSSYLQQSYARILYWDPEDETLSPSVGVCGAPLEEAFKLHLDLQEKYKNCGKIF